MPEMPLGPQPDRSLPDTNGHDVNDLSANAMPARALDVGEMFLAADFCNYRDHIGAEHKLPRNSSTFRALQGAIAQVGRLFDSDSTVSSRTKGEGEQFLAVCAVGGATSDERRAVALIEGITPSGPKFRLPAGSLKFYQPPAKADIFPVEMPPVEVLDDAAGVVVSVDREARKDFSLALMLTREAFDQAVSHLVKVAEFLDANQRENPQGWSCFFPLSSSIFALLFNEVRNHESPILGVKRLVGPSRNFVFQVSVLSLPDESRSSSIASVDSLCEATHHIAVRQNEFGIVEPYWLGRNVA